MSVFNNENYVAEAIDSILSQTFSNLEFIIVDDGSFDDTPQILDLYRDKDPRVIVYKNDKNIGLIGSLNLGFKKTQGSYVARMDADDISHPNRLERQLSFLSKHPEVQVVGTWLQIIDGPVWESPTGHENISSRLCFESALYHPTVMFRYQHDNKYRFIYDEKRQAAEDYDLWVRLVIDDKYKVDNIPEPLLERRIHGDSIGRRKKLLQKKIAGEIRRYQIEKLGIHVTEHEMSLHNKISEKKFEANMNFLFQCANWLNRLGKANRHTGIYPSKEYARTLRELWYEACLSTAKIIGIRVWLLYWYKRLTIF